MFTHAKKAERQQPRDNKLLQDLVDDLGHVIECTRPVHNTRSGMWTHSKGTSNVYAVKYTQQRTVHSRTEVSSVIFVVLLKGMGVQIHNSPTNTQCSEQVLGADT